MGKTETFKVFQGITKKSYYRKRISLRLCSSRRQEVREFRVSIGNLSAPHRSFILSAFVPLPFALSPATLPLSKRERSVARLPRRKITSLRVARVDVYGERNNARAQGGRKGGEEMLRRRQRARPRIRIYGTKIVTRPLANFPFKINANGRRSETRGLVY